MELTTPLIYSCDDYWDWTLFYVCILLFIYDLLIFFCSSFFTVLILFHIDLEVFLLLNYPSAQISHKYTFLLVICF